MFSLRLKELQIYFLLHLVGAVGDLGYSKIWNNLSEYLLHQHHPFNDSNRYSAENLDPNRSMFISYALHGLLILYRDINGQIRNTIEFETMKHIDIFASFRTTSDLGGMSMASHLNTVISTIQLHSFLLWCSPKTHLAHSRQGATHALTMTGLNSTANKIPPVCMF